MTSEPIKAATIGFSGLPVPSLAQPWPGDRPPFPSLAIASRGKPANSRIFCFICQVFCYQFFTKTSGIQDRVSSRRSWHQILWDSALPGHLIALDVLDPVGVLDDRVELAALEDDRLTRDAIVTEIAPFGVEDIEEGDP